MNTHRTRNLDYCRAIKINNVTDYPGIVVDTDGFEGAKIHCEWSCGDGWRSVRKGDFIIERDGKPIGVINKQDFQRHWEPIPATVRLVHAMKQLVQRAAEDGNMDEDEVSIWIEGSGDYGDGLTLGEIKAFLDEQKGIA